MHKRQKLSVAGIGAMGTAALLLSGCGGSSFQKNTFGNYANTLPAAYGIEPTAASSNVQASPTFFETSGLGSADSKTAYATAAIDFATLKNPDGSALAINVDPNATGKIPLGFSAGSFYIDSGAGSAAAVPATVAPIGTSSVFRAALANGVSANNAPPIDGNGESLSSADPEWTLGTLPMTFSSAGAGPLANGTYVTGTGGSAVPFTLPFKTSGVHSVVVTVTDTAGRQTASRCSSRASRSRSRRRPRLRRRPRRTRSPPATPSPSTAARAPGPTRRPATTRPPASPPPRPSPTPRGPWCCSPRPARTRSPRPTAQARWFSRPPSSSAPTWPA